LEAHQRKFLSKIQHSDRKLFFDCEYVLDDRLAQETLAEFNHQPDEAFIKEYEALESIQKDFFEQLYNVDDFDYHYETREYSPQDTSEYEIIFEDNEAIVLPGFRRVILIECSVRIPEINGHPFRKLADSCLVLFRKLIPGIDGHLFRELTDSHSGNRRTVILEIGGQSFRELTDTFFKVI
jgi:hypothetical protein